MARKKSSTAEELILLIARMPWWLGVILALVSYLLLHRTAKNTVALPAQPGQLAESVLSAMVTGLASVGQYLLPLICLAGSATSVWKRSQRKALLTNIANSRDSNSLNSMSWQEFEALVGEAFRLQGFAVTEAGGAGPDGGVDVILTKRGERFFVQCKQWKAYKVGVDVVRSLYGVMNTHGAVGGFVVTSGSYTEAARAFVQGINVTLIDGPQLFAMIQNAKQSLAKQPKSQPIHNPTEVLSSSPHCPLCASQMVKRTARKTGSMFWGCSQFPKCRGTRLSD